MNILMLSDVHFPRVNGVSTSIRTFAQSLARLGHAVTLVVPEYAPPEDGAEGAAVRRDDEGDAFEIVRLPLRVFASSTEIRSCR